MNVYIMFTHVYKLDEVVYIISQLQLSKVCGPNSIPTNLLKISSNILSPVIVLD